MPDPHFRRSWSSPDPNFDRSWSSLNILAEPGAAQTLILIHPGAEPHFGRSRRAGPLFWSTLDRGTLVLVESLTGRPETLRSSTAIADKSPGTFPVTGKTEKRVNELQYNVGFGQETRY